MELKPSHEVRRILLPSVVGPLLAEYDDRALRVLHFFPQGASPPAGTRVEPARSDALGWQIAQELREYFAGTRTAFTVPMDPAGSHFQRRVWDALVRIPYGETRSYGEIAAEVDGADPRSVGQANRRNPIPILIPCHRVVAAGGKMGGYGGEWGGDGEGMRRKAWLLSHEGLPR